MKFWMVADHEYEWEAEHRKEDQNDSDLPFPLNVIVDNDVWFRSSNQRQSSKFKWRKSAKWISKKEDRRPGR